MHCRLLRRGLGTHSRCAGQEAWSEEALGCGVLLKLRGPVGLIVLFFTLRFCGFEGLRVCHHGGGCNGGCY